VKLRFGGQKSLTIDKTTETMETAVMKTAQFPVLVRKISNHHKFNTRTAKTGPPPTHTPPHAHKYERIGTPTNKLTFNSHQHITLSTQKHVNAVITASTQKYINTSVQYISTSTISVHNNTSTQPLELAQCHQHVNTETSTHL
jgi:hypothetical protein